MCDRRRMHGKKVNQGFIYSWYKVALHGKYTNRNYLECKFLFKLVSDVMQKLNQAYYLSSVVDD